MKLRMNIRTHAKREATRVDGINEIGDHGSKSMEQTEPDGLHVIQRHWTLSSKSKNDFLKINWLIG